MTTLTAIPWEDLLSVPFLANGDDPSVGVDCWGMMCELARRAGLRPPDCARPRLPLVDEPDMAAFSYVGHHWERSTSRVADVLASDPINRGYASHFSTVVDVEHGLVLSTSKNGPFCWPAHRVECTLGVWRLS